MCQVSHIMCHVVGVMCHILGDYGEKGNMRCAGT